MLTQIRPADPSLDAAACAAIYAPYVADSWVSFEIDPPDAREMARRMTDYGDSHSWIVAEIEGSLAGYAYGSPHRSRAAYASSCDVAVYVDPTHARQGIGRALYAELFPLLAGRGCHAAFAGIALPNEASVGLHETMGFTPVGIYREVGWKLGGWRDVGWWQRLL
ncbi:GNAT family N-acetyltransferase [Croceibacterium sp. LX-88]|uniref:GNAT family N-acetyltransferase n=1 Tax=Croceibacterium selenioxidans TaxID=2838833 RepID=A0ABS5W4Y0_9SPHN|nr:GNAT family N-acetyltransferase [Croceibacterium selenioxidans]